MTIAQRQNTPVLLKLLRANSWHYRLAARWHFARILGTLLFAAAAPVVTFWWRAGADGVAAAAGAWVLVGRTLLAMAEERQIARAVNIQEQFDVELFDLPWNASLVGPKVAPEDVSDAALHISDDRLLRNWYADTGSAKWPLDVLLCQRSSAVWGRRAHFAYAVTVASLGGGWFLAGIAMGLLANLTLADYLIKLFLPSQPAFLDTVELIRRHLGQATDKQEIERQTDALFAACLADPRTLTPAACRGVQDQAYRLRRHGPRVAQWFYRLRRGRDQQAMEAAVADLLARMPDGK